MSEVTLSSNGEEETISISLRKTLLSSSKSLDISSVGTVYITTPGKTNVSNYTINKLNQHGTKILSVRHLNSLQVKEAMREAMKKRAERHLKSGYRNRLLDHE